MIARRITKITPRMSAMPVIGDQRRARALAFRSLVLERLRGLDGVLDRVHDVLCLVDRMGHAHVLAQW